MSKLKILLIAIFSFFLFGAAPEDEGLYQLDLGNSDTYEVSCFDQLNTKWVVSNDSCCLTTSVISLPGNDMSDPLLDVPIDINIFKTGNLDDTDLARLQYRINGNRWITLDELSGTEIPNSQHLYSYKVVAIAAGSDLEFRLVFVAKGHNKKLTLISNPANNMFIGVPFITGTDTRFEGASLPVVLSYFSFEIFNDVVELEWTTSSEINNDYFEIHRSFNGSDFDIVGTVPGAGNSNSSINYFWSDLEPLLGTVYYRLKQVDYDGKHEYSRLLAVSRDAESGDCVVKVNPNPCLGSCRVYLENCDHMKNQKVNLMVFDALGNVVSTQTAINNSDDNALFSVNSDNNLSPGVYFVKASTFNQSAETKLVQN
jgi:hypothetical protein